MSKILAIGDIHTKQWILDLVENVIHKYDRVIFLGDYIDDWEAEPMQNINILKRMYDFEQWHEDKVRLVIGNHDYGYAFNTPTTHSGFSPMTHTLLHVPENKYLVDWLRNMQVIYEEDDVFYSHAGITEEWQKQFSDSFSVKSLWSPISPIWARPDEVTYSEIKQVIGHNTYETCLQLTPTVWCIDTFSTYPNGIPVGDYTVLEIVNGEQFNKINLKNKNDNNSNLAGIAA